MNIDLDIKPKGYISGLLVDSKARFVSPGTININDYIYKVPVRLRIKHPKKFIKNTWYHIYIKTDGESLECFSDKDPICAKNIRRIDSRLTNNKKWFEFWKKIKFLKVEFCRHLVFKFPEGTVFTTPPDVSIKQFLNMKGK